MGSEIMPSEVRQPDRIAYTVPEVAQMLDIKESTLYRQVKQGQFPAIKIGRYWRIPKDRLDTFLQEGGREE